MDDEVGPTADNGSRFDDSWPEEPTSVEAVLTMEQLILQELSRQGGISTPAAIPQDGLSAGTGGSKKGPSIR